MGYLQYVGLAKWFEKLMKVSSIQAQVATNITFTIIKAVSLVFSIWIADFYLSASTMGLLLLFRRQGALWGNLLQLGFSQCLQKFYISNDNKKEQYLLWGTLNRWVIISSFFGLVVSILFTNQLDELLFGLQDGKFVKAFGVYAGALALGFMACSSWMTEFRFGYANIIDWLNGSLIFVICVFLLQQTPAANIVMTIALLTLFVSLVSLVCFCLNYVSLKALFEKNLKLNKNVIRFGFSRGVSSFLDMGLLIIGPWLLKDSPQDVGYLLIAYNALRLAPTIVLPIAQVLALRSNSSRYNSTEEKRNVLKLAVLSVIGSCLAIGGYYIFGQAVLSVWLPKSACEVGKILDELIFFVPAFCLFYSIRNYIELKYLFPWNMVILFIAIIGLIIGYEFSTLQGLDAVIIGSQVMLGLLSFAALLMFLHIAFEVVFIEKSYKL